MIVDVAFDGGCLNNPNGQASSGAIVRSENGHTLRHVGVAIGIASNNVAEWSALKFGLEAALDVGASQVRAFGDSKLVVEQFAGRYAVRSEGLRSLAIEVSQLARRFPAGVTVTWVPRESNREADAICSAVLAGSYVADSVLGVPLAEAPAVPVHDVEVTFMCTVRMDRAKAQAALAAGTPEKALRKQLAAQAETRLLLASRVDEFRITPVRVNG